MNFFLKRLLLVCTVWQLVASGAANCQIGFNKIIDIPNTLSLNFDDIVYEGDRLIVRGNAYYDSLNLWGLFIAGLDTNGIVLWHNTIVDTFSQSPIITNTPGRFIINNDNNFVIPTAYFNTNKMGIFILDSIGKELISHIFPKYGLLAYPYDIIQSNNFYYIFGRIVRENYIGDVFILKSDSSGHERWIKYYGTPQTNETFGDVLKNNDGTFTISSSVYSDDYYDEPFGHGWRRPWIFTVDTSGQIRKQWTGQQNDIRTLGGGPLFKTNDGDWIVVSYEHKAVLSAGQTDINSAPTVSKLDPDFNLIWKIYLSDFNNIYDFINDLEYDAVRDEYILTGDIGIQFNPWSGALEGWICKLSSEGDVLWSMADTALYDPNHYVQHHLGGVALSPHGSIYAAGYIDHSIPPGINYGWIIKVTPDGCIDTICTTVSVEDQMKYKEVPIPVYPNPTTDLLNINLKDILSTPLTITFISVDGKVLGTSILQSGLNSITLKDVIGNQRGVIFYKILGLNQIISQGKIIRLLH